MLFTHFVKTYELQNDKVLLPKKQLVTYALYALIAVALLYLFFFEPEPPGGGGTEARTAVVVSTSLPTR
jgi:xyloglucan O-acetyltransferase